MMDTEDILCPFCCQEEELTSHLLFPCSLSIWKQCYKWLGLQVLMPKDFIRNKFLQHFFYSVTGEELKRA